MARVEITFDRRKLDAMIVGAYQLHGEAILFGQPGPAPMHRGRDGRGSKVTTAFTLAVVEFGHPSTRKARARGSRSRGRKRRRGLLGRLLKSFRGRRVAARAATTPKIPTDKARERPVIRWVAAARRDAMRDGFKAAAKQALRRKDPRPDLEALGERLVFILGDRLRAVGGVDTGHTLETLGYRIVRRYGGG